MSSGTYNHRCTVSPFYVRFDGRLLTAAHSSLQRRRTFHSDWPLAYGSMVPPLVGGIRYEYGHRVFAGVIATLTVVAGHLAVAQREARLGALFRLDRRVHGDAQAILGGLTVRLRHRYQFRGARMSGSGFLLRRCEFGAVHEPLVAKRSGRR